MVINRELLERCLRALCNPQDRGYFQPLIDDVKKVLEEDGKKNL